MVGAYGWRTSARTFLDRGFTGDLVALDRVLSRSFPRCARTRFARRRGTQVQREIAVVARSRSSKSFGYTGLAKISKS